MSYPSDICQPALEHLFRQNPPTSLLAIGPDASDAFAAWHEHATRVEIDIIDSISEAEPLENLQRAGRHDVAFVTHTLENLDKPQAEQLVAALRDRYAHRLFVLLPIGDDWPDQRSYWSLTDMTALGLRQVACFEYEGRPVHLYRFDIYDYKLTPDWLNPRFWANPEMWDRARW